MPETVTGHHNRGHDMMFYGQIEFLNKNVMTWPATQVGLRGVKAGLGGHEAGVFGVDDGVENISLPL